MFKKYAIIAAATAWTLLTYSQNVGIGVEHPGSKLSVAGGISIGETYAGKKAPDGTILIEKSMGIGTDTIDPNVVLDIRSTTKGVLFPTMNTEKRNSIINPPKGLFVFNEDSSGFNFYNGTSWLNFALLGPTGPIGAAASILGLNGAQGSGYGATSVSLATISTGTKVLATQPGLSYRTNDRVRISAASNKYMEGTVTTYLAGILTVDVDRTVGGGSALSWHIGLAGDMGATGSTGPAGNNGANGATWLSGAGAPASGLGSVHDFYINSSNGTYYKKTNANTWTNQGSIKGATGSTGVQGPAGSAGAVGPQGPAGAIGAQGPQGIAGATGATGATGNSLLTGSGVPAGALGNVNDFYLNAIDGGYYFKTGSSTWTYVGNLKGATGATGATGANGTNGTNGAVGPQGPAGAVGAVGPQGPAGAAGAQGIQGLKGNTGATGATGANGTNGTNGAVGAVGPAGAAGSNGTVWHTAAGVPASGTGAVNDFYLNASNGTYYKKTNATTWTSQGSLKGATGAAGAQGIQGLKGATGATGANGTNGTNGAAGAVGPQGPAGVAGSNGTVWHTGASTNNGTGVNGDFFLASNGSYYKKVSGAWGSSLGSLKGPTGATGTLANGSTAGNTPYWNGSAWIVNNSNIFNNGANVGIGTTSPGHKFEVMNGNLSVDNTNNTAGSLVMYEPSNSGTNFTAFKARAQAADITYNLPTSQAANTILINDGAGNLTWTPVNSTVTTMFEKKAANESITNNTLQDDNDFTYTLEPNQSYEVSGLIRIGAHADGEWAFKFVAPAQTQTLISMAYNTEYLDEMMYVTAPNTTYYMLNDGANQNTDVVFVNGMVTTGNNGGTFKFQWAQRYTNATATTIYANSYLRLTRAQ